MKGGAWRRRLGLCSHNVLWHGWRVMRRISLGIESVALTVSLLCFNVLLLRFSLFPFFHCHFPDAVLFRHPGWNVSEPVIVSVPTTFADGLASADLA